jgi:hypothetical protein
MAIVVWNISNVPPVGGSFHKTWTMRLHVPSFAGAVTVLIAGLAGAVERISELFGGNMFTIT